MPLLKPIIYNNKAYPSHVKSSIKEVAGHFDVSKKSIQGDYSLHTEYSFMPRNFKSEMILRYPCLCESNKRGIPQLWFSKQWAVEFAAFIIELTKESNAPMIIEVHPPFSDYSNLEMFLLNYDIFIRIIKSKYPDTTILLENRCGTRYQGGSFIVSDVNQLTVLSAIIDNTNIDLKITLDVPQLFTAHNITPPNTSEMEAVFEKIKLIRHNILGIHLWGKRKNSEGKPIAHNGDLNSYFDNNMDFKKIFLNLLYDAFDDDINRFFVPEVNGKLGDLHSIVNDLEEAGFTFE